MKLIMAPEQKTGERKRKDVKLKSVGIATLLADEIPRLGWRGWERVKPQVWRTKAPLKPPLSDFHI